MNNRRRAKRGEARKLFEEFAAYRGNECKLWPFSVGTNSRGRKMPQVGLDGRRQCVTRAICERVHGPAPGPNYDAAHDPEICNNPMCCTPSHLSWATHKENCGLHKHRAGNGSITEPPRKLTREEVHEIYYATGPQREIAERFGVCQPTVSSIKRGKNIYSPAWISPVKGAAE